MTRLFRCIRFRRVILGGVRHGICGRTRITSDLLFVARVMSTSCRHRDVWHRRCDAHGVTFGCGPIKEF
jgi:hypothetical protein